MIDPTIAAIIGSICAMVPPSLIAWAALRQGKVNGEKADQAKELAADTRVTIGEVKDLSNGNYSKLAMELKRAHTEIKRLNQRFEKYSNEHPHRASTGVEAKKPRGR